MNNIKVLVTGKNVYNYVSWLIKSKIPIINMDIISYKELNIIVNIKYYKLLKKYSSTYTVTIIKYYGMYQILNIIKNHKYIIISLILSIIILYFLSHLTFKIEIVSNDKDMITLLSKELDNNGIKKYSYLKDYKELEQIKDNILNNNKDILEWLEITRYGTKYTVKFVERKQNIIKSSYDYQSIIASKSAIITDIVAYSGEKIKDINSYIEKNDVAISGILTKPNGTFIYKKALGYIYGEVWYKVDIEYPYTYKEEKVTGNKKNVLSIKFLNKELNIFPYKKYKQFKVEEKVLLSDKLNLFKITNKELYEVKINEYIYTEDELIDKCLDKAIEELKLHNDKIIEVLDTTILKKENLNTKIKLNVFISVKEDITKIVEVKKEEINDNLS